MRPHFALGPAGVNCISPFAATDERLHVVDGFEETSPPHFATDGATKKHRHIWLLSWEKYAANRRHETKAQITATPLRRVCAKYAATFMRRAHQNYTPRLTLGLNWNALPRLAAGPRHSQQIDYMCSAPLFCPRVSSVARLFQRAAQQVAQC